MKNYNKYIFVKFLYDFILTTILFLLTCFMICKYNLFNLQSYFSTNIAIFLEMVYGVILLFRVFSGYDNIIPRFLTLRDIILGKSDSKKIEKDYKADEFMYEDKYINLPHIKELNTSKHYWINKLIMEFNNYKEKYKEKLENINKFIKINNNELKNNNDELHKINLQLKQKNNATQIYYLTGKKKEIEEQINNLEFLIQENQKKKNVLTLEFENKYMILEKEKNMIKRDFEIRYKNYTKSVLKKINRCGYNYKIETLEEE